MDLRRALRGLLVVRLVLFGAVFLSSLLIETTAGVSVATGELGAAAAIAIALSLAHLGIFRGTRPERELTLQLAGDAVAVTFLVHASGGSGSVFTFLYLAVVAAGSLLVGRGAGLTLASWCSVVYGFLLEGSAYGLLPPPLSAPDASFGASPTYSLAVYLLAFYSIALLSGVIGDKLRAAREEISSRRTELERMRALHADVIESMSSGLATLDDRGEVTFVNPAGREILGLPGEGLAGFADRLSALLAGPWRTPDGEGTRRGEVEYAAGGRRGILGYSLRRLHGRGGSLLLFQDLTEIKQLESEGRAREKLAAVGQLAAGIAHEIRNPLASISGSAQMLREEMRSGSAGRRLLEIIVQESRRLSKILDDFLSYARPGPPRRRPFAIGPVLSESMELFRNSAEVLPLHRLVLDLGARDCLVDADPDHVRQIFWNVARNAVRAMPDGGELRVTGALSDGWYTMRFQDSGRGMTPEERDQLFQPFASSFGEGTGLGMAIVRRLTEDLGGRIGVESSSGEGTTVEIRLPRAKSAAGSPAA